MTGAIVGAAILFIFYTYAGYPALLWGWSHWKRGAGEFPSRPVPLEFSVTVLIAAHNEESCIGDTLRSVLGSEFPSHRLTTLVVSDASTDRTNAILASFNPQGVHSLILSSRTGKTGALARALPGITTDLVVLADASGIFEPQTIAALVRHFTDPQVGAVSGRKVGWSTGRAVSRGDGLYGRYDAMIRRLETESGGSWVGCEGGLFAVRTSLLTFDFPSDIAEDYAVGCRVFQKGYRTIFDRDAVVYEPASNSFAIEFRRKIRVIVRGIKGLWAFRFLWVPRNLSFVIQNVSHRLCRWLVPFGLVALLIATGLSAAAWARGVLVSQLVFYGLALAGAWGGRLTPKKMPWLFSVPLYFTVVNLAALMAWPLLFRRYAVWNSTARESNQEESRR